MVATPPERRQLPAGLPAGGLGGAHQLRAGFILDLEELIEPAAPGDAGRRLDDHSAEGSEHWEERDGHQVVAVRPICDRYGVPPKAAAAQFPFGYPAISSVLFGVRSPPSSTTTWRCSPCGLRQTFGLNCAWKDLSPLTRRCPLTHRANRWPSFRLRTLYGA